jgi:hypothetical protein
MVTPTMSETTTLAEITRTLDITLVALYQWRKGSNKRPPLPIAVTRRGDARRVAVYTQDLKVWLERWRPDLLPRLEKRLISQ